MTAFARPEYAMLTALNNAATAYARVGLETGVPAASPHRLIEMLFDGAILTIAQAREAMLERDFARKGQAISRAIEIVEGGLRASLDRDAGGDLARQLDGLYDYMAGQLLAASAHNRTEPLDTVARLLGELRQAWIGIGPGAPTAPAAAGRAERTQ